MVQSGKLLIAAFVVAAQILCLSLPADATAQTDQAVKKTAVTQTGTEVREGQTSTVPPRLEEAGRTMVRTVTSIEEKASDLLGPWVTFELYRGITWLKLGLCLSLLILVFIVDRALRLIIFVRLRALSREKKRLEWTRVLLDALAQPLSLIIWVYGIYIAASPLFPHLAAPDGTNIVQLVLRKAADIAGTIALIWFVYRLVAIVDLEVKKWVESTERKIDDLLIHIVGKTIRVLVVLLGGILFVQNLTGIEMGPLLASLGLGGLAVALAAKDSVANLFGTVTILFDQPFEIGETVKLDGFTGNVEYVGFRSTRLRTPEGHLITIPNHKITNANVENITRRPYIRWQTNITLTCDTPPEKVERAVQILLEILDNHEGMKENLPPRVYFNAFNDWSLNIQVTAFYHSGNYWDYQAWLNKTCLEILRRFNEEGIEFAFPTRTLYLAHDEKRPLKLDAQVSLVEGKIPDT